MWPSRSPLPRLHRRAARRHRARAAHSLLAGLVRIIKGFFATIGHVTRPEDGTSRWQLQTVDQRLAWMIILATIPVGLIGLKFEHEFRVLFGKPIRAAIFLVINGLILLAGEFFRRKASVRADEEIAQERELVAVGGARRTGSARHAAGHQAEPEAEYELGVQSDQRFATQGYLSAFLSNGRPPDVG